MKTVHRLVVSISLACLMLAQTPADAQTAAPTSVLCGELPFDSFPPNQLLGSDNPDGSIFRVLQSGRPGGWAEFFVRVDRAGTYRVDVQSRKGPDRAIFQLNVDGELVGETVDCYASQSTTTPVETPVGDVTFQKAGTYSFRFLVTGKNPSGNGLSLALERITLTPVAGFTLLSPNGSCAEGPDVFLRWNAWSAAKQYRVEMDGRSAATVDAPATTYQAAGLARGAHRWRVVTVDAAGKEKPSDTFSFVVGPPLPYPYREFSEAFASGNAAWSLESMTLAKNGAAECLQAVGPGTATLKDVRLDKTEGEVATHVTLGSADTSAGVGFQSDDGTRIYAVVDLKRQQLRLERRVAGPGRYSIFEVTPRAYQVPGWLERAEADGTVWEIAAKPVPLQPGTTCELKLAYSRRSAAVMATLTPADGSPPTTLRDLTDLRTPDHPLLLALSGSATFADASLRLLNKLVYKWNPDTTCIVLRPGPPGSWDEKGAFNPAIIVRDGKWHMIYRGNSKPAPPNGPVSSELGLATSADGVHWTKHPANPVVPKQSSGDSVEDPDLIWPKGSDEAYLEYNSHYKPEKSSTPPVGTDPPREWPRGEVMRASKDFVHWSYPWILNTGKTFGKNGGFVDTQDAGIPGIQFDGASYRYVSMIEEGRIDVSNDLHQWVKAGTSNLRGSRDQWCSSHECSGDIFVDADKNIRFESQIGVNPEPGGHGGAVVGNRLCTIGEGVLSGSDPTQVLWRSDLPWLTDWYGDAPTGAPEDFTATNGSVFPGQTIIKDGWLRHYSGGNNHCVLLTECWYGPLVECRDLQAVTDAAGQCSVSVVARNVGSLHGTCPVILSIDGQALPPQRVTLDRDKESTLQWKVPVPSGVHTLAVDDLSVTLGH